MAAVPTIHAYTDFVEFIVERVSADDILAFKASPAAERRATFLMDRFKSETITPDEKAELEHIAQIDLLVRMLKARAINM